MAAAPLTTAVLRIPPHCQFFFQSFCNSPRGMNLKTAKCIFFGNCSPESYSMLDTKLWELKVVKRRSKTLREWTKETGALVRGEDWNVRQSVYNLDIYFQGTETIAIQTLYSYTYLLTHKNFRRKKAYVWDVDINYN